MSAVAVGSKVRSGFLVAAWGCLACQATTAPPPATGDPKLVIAPRSEASPVEPQPLRVRLQGKSVELPGEPTLPDTMALRGGLARRRGSATTLEAELVAPDGGTLDSLIAATLGTELRRLVLLEGPARFEIALVPSRRPTHELSPGTDGLLHLRTLGDGSDLSEAAWPPGDDGVTAEVQAKLGQMCGAGCVVQVSHVAKDAEILLLSMLRSLQRVGQKQSGLEVYVNVYPSGLRPTSSTGSLPPEVIQRIVRQNFERIRTCYEAGLARDPKLTGRVTVRFVISTEGSVTSASDEKSELSDAQVRDCVVEQFKQMSFPKPERGKVTVVYPILLAPE